MKIFFDVFGLAVLFITLSANAHELKETDSAVSILHAALPNVNWDNKTAVSADINCDGKEDVAIVGYANNQAVWLGVVTGTNNGNETKPVTMKMLVGKHSQNSFCSIPVRLETHPLKCVGEEDVTLPGCKIVKGCFALTMLDDSCDSFNFYWDSSKSRLTWWRR